MNMEMKFIIVPSVMNCILDFIFVLKIMLNLIFEENRNISDIIRLKIILPSGDAFIYLVPVM